MTERHAVRGIRAGRRGRGPAHGRGSIPLYAAGARGLRRGHRDDAATTRARASRSCPNGFPIVAVGVALSLAARTPRGAATSCSARPSSEQRAELDRAQRRPRGAPRRNRCPEIVERADEVERLNAQLRRRCARARPSCRWRSRSSPSSAAGGRAPRGTVLGDRFEVARRIGEGGMGAVYVGRRPDHGRARRHQGHPGELVAAARRAAPLRARGARAATVTHPAVVRMLHVDVSDDGLLFQVQELVDGETLQRGAPAHRWARRRRGARSAPCSARRSPRRTRAASCTATSSPTT